MNKNLDFSKLKLKSNLDKNERYKFYKKNTTNIHKLVRLKYKVLSIKLNKKHLRVMVLAYLINTNESNIEKCRFYIDSETYQECELKQYTRQISKKTMIKDKNIYIFKFKISDILKDESRINGSIRFGVNINGE